MVIHLLLLREFQNFRNNSLKAFETEIEENIEKNYMTNDVRKFKNGRNTVNKLEPKNPFEIAR